MSTGHIPPFLGIKIVEKIPMSGPDSLGIVRGEFPDEAMKLFRPAAVYGYFRCISSGNRLMILDPTGREKNAFEFPVISGESIASYFGTEQCGYDIAPFFVCTAGQELSDKSSELFDDDSYSKGYRLHNLASKLAERVAAFVNERVLSELGIYSGTGKRYSPGYPMWPELSDQKGVFELLKPEAIGVFLGESYQMKPQASVSGLIVPNRNAKYFTKD